LTVNFARIDALINELDKNKASMNEYSINKTKQDIQNNLNQVEDMLNEVRTSLMPHNFKLIKIAELLHDKHKENPGVISFYNRYLECNNHVNPKLDDNLPRSDP